MANAQGQVEQKAGSERCNSLACKLPIGYTRKSMGRNDQVDALLEIRVIREHNDLNESGSTTPAPWPGPERVIKWYELVNGKKVGWVIDGSAAFVDMVQGGEWQFVVRD